MDWRFNPTASNADQHLDEDHPINVELAREQAAKEQIRKRAKSQKKLSTFFVLIVLGAVIILSSVLTR